MDHFFQEPMLHFDDDDNDDDDHPFLYDINPVIQSSFLPYTSGPRSETGGENSSSGTNRENPSNMNKRRLEFTRRSWAVQTGSLEQANTGRGYRHMISERLRRERERMSYSALHSLLPLGTKNDKQSIVQTAARQIQEMKRYKGMLERRISELEGELASLGSESSSGGSRISFRVDNRTTSGVDSTVEVLKRLKRLGLKTKGVQLKSDDQELVAVIDIDSGIEAVAEAEKAVTRTFQESRPMT